VTVTGNGVVTSSPAGFDCGTGCSKSYASGTSVTLTATGADFLGWSGGGCSGTSTCAVTMNADTTVTATWSGPTVLVANFLNGNTDLFNSRVYLWNPSTTDGNVTVRVFTLPPMGGLVQELTDTPLTLGTLGAKSALNIKLAEDILTPLGIETPYTTDGGNLTLEVTIQAADVRAAAQVFSSNFGFGTYPLQEVPSTSTGSPTVLVANFMNGNNDAFNSRIYLWNPTLSAGNVTVRVFTLPLRGGLAQELTVTALDLGALGARSALNIKLAEDILTPLGIALAFCCCCCVGILDRQRLMVARVGGRIGGRDS